MILIDKINRRLEGLITDALKKASGYDYCVNVDNDNDCNNIICHITALCSGDESDFWLYYNRDEITKILYSSTDMTWKTPATPGRNRWILKKGAVMWSCSIQNSCRYIQKDATEYIEYHVFNNGEFSDPHIFVDDEELKIIDWSLLDHLVKEDDFVFCEGIEK